MLSASPRTAPRLSRRRVGQFAKTMRAHHLGRRVEPRSQAPLLCTCVLAVMEQSAGPARSARPPSRSSQAPDARIWWGERRPGARRGGPALGSHQYATYSPAVAPGPHLPKRCARASFRHRTQPLCPLRRIRQNDARASFSQSGLPHARGPLLRRRLPSPDWRLGPAADVGLLDHPAR